MNIKDIQDFKLSDAVKFHDSLNPALFGDEKLHPEVRDQLLKIADDFLLHLGVSDLEVKDITLSGSNAAYTYTPHSDIDLHLLVDISKLKNDEIYRELFNSKKVIYNDAHDIKVKGYDVELYVQDTAEPVKSLGEYSVLNDKWIKFPGKMRSNLDERAAREKFMKLVQLSELALRSGDSKVVDNLIDKIKKYRRAGLDEHGEFGPENIAFKALRSRGIVDKLYDHRDKLHSKDLSLAEKRGMTDEDYDPNGPPPGPEFKPTMPKGTVRVDVSDVYDWYKLGQHISNLKGLGKHDFGKGPPSTILSFGDEDTEHQYIKDLEATGLSTTDIDPIDPHQPKGMKRQKVDPTYNVNEKINPKIVEKNFRAEKTIDIKDVGPLKLEAYNISTEYPQQFRVDVSTPDGNKIGHFRFVVQDYESEPKYKVFSLFKKKGDPYLVAGNVSVWNEFQRKGIATEVYKWIKSMGNDIKPSPHQTDAGKAMWHGFEKNKTIDESASGYIPSSAEKNDPRFKTALTVDVKPDSIQQNAKKLGLGNIKRSGVPRTAKSNGKI